MTAYYRAPVRRIAYRAPHRYRRRSAIDSRLAGAAIVAVVAAAGGITGHHGHHHAAPGHAPAAVASVPAGGFTPESWSRAVLTAAHLPVTACNVIVMAAWARRENGNWGNQARFNVLNSTQSEPGSSWFESTGPGAARIRIYTSWQQGIDATVTTLTNGYYPGILAALRAGNSASAVAAAVDASPWGTRSLIASC